MCLCVCEEVRIFSSSIWQLNPPRLLGRASPTDAVFHVGSPANQSCRPNSVHLGQVTSAASAHERDHGVSSFLSCLFRARVDRTSLPSSGFSAMTGPSDCAIAEKVLPACFLVVSNLINLRMLLHMSDDHCYFCDPHLVDVKKLVATVHGCL